MSRSHEKMGRGWGGGGGGLGEEGGSGVEDELCAGGGGGWGVGVEREVVLGEVNVVGLGLCFMKT